MEGGVPLPIEEDELSQDEEQAGQIPDRNNTPELVDSEFSDEDEDDEEGVVWTTSPKSSSNNNDRSGDTVEVKLYGVKMRSQQPFDTRVSRDKRLPSRHSQSLSVWKKPTNQTSKNQKGQLQAQARERLDQLPSPGPPCRLFPVREDGPIGAQTVPIFIQPASTYFLGTTLCAAVGRGLKDDPAVEECWQLTSEIARVRDEIGFHLYNQAKALLHGLRSDYLTFHNANSKNLSGQAWGKMAAALGPQYVASIIQNCIRINQHTQKGVMIAMYGAGPGGDVVPFGMWEPETTGWQPAVAELEGLGGSPIPLEFKGDRMFVRASSYNQPLTKERKVNSQNFKAGIGDAPYLRLDRGRCKLPSKIMDDISPADHADIQTNSITNATVASLANEYHTMLVDPLRSIVLSTSDAATGPPPTEGDSRGLHSVHFIVAHLARCIMDGPVTGAALTTKHLGLESLAAFHAILAHMVVFDTVEVVETTHSRGINSEGFLRCIGYRGFHPVRHPTIPCIVPPRITTAGAYADHLLAYASSYEMHMETAGHAHATQRLNNNNAVQSTNQELRPMVLKTELRFGMAFNAFQTVVHRHSLIEQREKLKRIHLEYIFKFGYQQPAEPIIDHEETQARATINSLIKEIENIEHAIIFEQKKLDEAREARDKVYDTYHTRMEQNRKDELNVVAVAPLFDLVGGDALLADGKTECRAIVPAYLSATTSKRKRQQKHLETMKWVLGFPGDRETRKTRKPKRRITLLVNHFQWLWTVREKQREQGDLEVARLWAALSFPFYYGILFLRTQRIPTAFTVLSLPRPKPPKGYRGSANKLKKIYDMLASISTPPKVLLAKVPVGEESGEDVEKSVRFNLAHLPNALKHQQVAFVVTSVEPHTTLPQTPVYFYPLSPLVDPNGVDRTKATRLRQPPWGGEVPKWLLTLPLNTVTAVLLLYSNAPPTYDTSPTQDYKNLMAAVPLQIWAHTSFAELTPKMLAASWSSISLKSLKQNRATLNRRLIPWGGTNHKPKKECKHTENTQQMFVPISSQEGLYTIVVTVTSDTNVVSTVSDDESDENDEVMGGAG